jgi:hypothetical protein
MFVLDVDTLKFGYYSPASDYWEVKQVDVSKGGIYIPIDRFQPSNLSKIHDLEKLKKVITAMEYAGMKIDVPIYGIKKGMDIKGLERFDTWVESKVKANTTLLKDYSIAMSASDYSLTDVSAIKEKDLPDGSLAKEYTTAYKALKSFGSTGDKKYQIFSYYPVDVKPDKTVKKLSDKFKLKFPLLNYISNYNYGMPEVIEYIKGQEEKGEEAAKAASA